MSELKSFLHPAMYTCGLKRERALIRDYGIYVSLFLPLFLNMNTTAAAIITVATVATAAYIMGKVN